MNKKVWVDPPSGWKYGFPKIYDPDADGDLVEWIAKCGYPEAERKSYGQYFHIRMWPAEEPKEPNEPDSV
jgi:hypothetical protein